MKNKLHRYFLIAAGMVTLAGAPALFAGDWQYNGGYDRGYNSYERQDLRRDYNHLARQNEDIRRDQWRLHEDLEHGRYGRAARQREDLRHDYAERNAQRRDIWRDERCR